jgi:hypothetical protein
LNIHTEAAIWKTAASTGQHQIRKEPFEQPVILVVVQRPSVKQAFDVILAA